MEAFSANLGQIQKWVGPQVKIMAVLKADGYGHGAIPLAKKAEVLKIPFIGVSSLEEGIVLRNMGIHTPILILGGIFPLDNFGVALEYDLTPMVSSFESAEALSKAARKRKNSAPFHLKVDTGMGRLGSTVASARKILDWVASERAVRLEGVYSHFAAADADDDFTREQLANLLELKDAVKDSIGQKTLFHIANTAGLFGFKESHLDMVRPGISLYGETLRASPASVTLEPVLSWYSKIVFLKKIPKGATVSYNRTYRAARESEIATLPVGYADGVPRLASNKGSVLIKGRRCPIVGRVTMDQIMVDVTGAGAAVGDPVVLIGRQGAEKISAAEWASWAETISYEIFCGISKRVPRVVI